MTTYHCVKCNYLLIDPELYWKAKGEKRTGWKMRVMCPVCEKVQSIREMTDKEILSAPLIRLTFTGAKRKQKLILMTITGKERSGMSECGIILNRSLQKSK